MVQNTKSINGKVLKKMREDLNLSQQNFAELCGVNFRTIQNAEYGNPLTLSKRQKILDSIVNESLSSNRQVDENILRRDLEPVQSTISSAGYIESDHHKKELDKVDPVVPEYSPHVIDPFNNEARLLQESDFIDLRREAYDVSSDLKNLNKFIKSVKNKEHIWHTNVVIDENDAILALEELEKAINSIEKSETTQSLKDLTSQIKTTNQIRDALGNFNSLGYQVFEGIQETFWSKIPIFFIDRYHIKKIYYTVKSLHPMFGENNSAFPYYSLEGGKIGNKSWALTYIEKPMVLTSVDMNLRPKDDNGVPYEYPTSFEEKQWVELCEKIIKEFSPEEKKIYDDHIDKFI